MHRPYVQRFPIDSGTRVAAGLPPRGAFTARALRAIIGAIRGGRRAGRGDANMAEPMGATAMQAQGELLRLVIGENNADLAVTLTLLLNAEPDIRCVATVSSTTAVLGRSRPI